MMVWALLPIAAATAVSCGPGPLYSEDPRDQAAISPRSQWKASGTLQDPQAAVDGRFETAATTNAGGANARLIVDLGKPSLFNMVVLEQGRYETAFPRRVQLATGLENGNFRTVGTATGNRRVTIISTIGPVLARYIELSAEPGREGWAVAELHLK